MPYKRYLKIRFYKWYTKKALIIRYWTAKSYRETYNLFFFNSILFNPESEVRRPEFVTRRISMKVAKIIKGDK